MNHELYMTRALELATLGRGFVSPNPMVGCVLVYDDRTGPRIIGEGWHQRYGGPHAEVNAVRSVRPEDEHLLPQATAYVTLEPCSHYGKTPPCADLLVEKRVSRVVVCNDDPNPLVAGRGLTRLREAGIAVETGVLAERGRELNRRFFTQMEQQRPYILLKWAETSDGFIGGPGGQPVSISGPLAQRLVHRWRAEEPAIMVGTNTARNDNPSLNVRLWHGLNPTRIVIDKMGTLPQSLHVFDGSQPTLCYTYNEPPADMQATCVTLNSGKDFLSQLLADLHHRHIQSVLVEGGVALLSSFIQANLWDEMRVFRSPKMLGAGVPAPAPSGRLVSREMVGPDELSIYRAR
ncbi:bifunctional diaminohydroxyphosphoribosylaminopyrimidine deaminase/5-amino-6-(5-phosphoribosylamino)uracil reductase RibD [Rudanella paleaurantiibacter]|uniref:Riboflavin biosynthesis protein RibD n=1 Tax=Rudanella paleaurantiibacter TaxID=2614655 RepID=A0A7J5TSF2_9BACT|nr:bifunctional diaminohydroxyphosphoribosylaminopyrimidine deaminase/5-amino-6-(5-phosphoribosylamino)uracil reductase RibD [Rudanella paleaurantiibacter]KAB7725963.1 bifunctional diaminohydroxyphosphoribosylaminopyrimidine deaminase/5-amino-6-(5-phosphoribosylamino)uracil reductase RibD [Rudanella paleaurantiibacter]